MKKKLFKITYILLAIIVVAVLYFVAQSKIISTPNIDFSNIIPDKEISEFNITDIKTDSFTALAGKAYGTLLKMQKNGSVLELTLDNTNKLGSDFYNSNQNLLKFKRIDYGFEIKNDEQTGTIVAQFDIKNDSYVPVPNDILLKMMYKAYNK